MTEGQANPIFERAVEYLDRLDEASRLLRRYHYDVTSMTDAELVRFQEEVERWFEGERAWNEEARRELEQEKALQQEAASSSGT